MFVQFVDRCEGFLTPTTISFLHMCHQYFEILKPDNENFSHARSYSVKCFMTQWEIVEFSTSDNLLFNNCGSENNVTPSICVWESPKPGTPSVQQKRWSQQEINSTGWCSHLKSNRWSILWLHIKLEQILHVNSTGDTKFHQTQRKSQNMLQIGNLWIFKALFNCNLVSVSFQVRRGD